MRCDGCVCGCFCLEGGPFAWRVGHGTGWQVAGRVAKYVKVLGFRGGVQIARFRPAWVRGGRLPWSARQAVSTLLLRERAWRSVLQQSSCTTSCAGALTAQQLQAVYQWLQRCWLVLRRVPSRRKVSLLGLCGVQAACVRGGRFSRSVRQT